MIDREAVRVVLNALYEVASDDDAATIEDVAIAAGLLKRCTADDCRWTNHADANVCELCGSTLTEQGGES